MSGHYGYCGAIVGSNLRQCSTPLLIPQNPPSIRPLLSRSCSRARIWLSTRSQSDSQWIFNDSWCCFPHQQAKAGWSASTQPRKTPFRISGQALQDRRSHQFYQRFRCLDESFEIWWRPDGSCSSVSSLSLLFPGASGSIWLRSCSSSPRRLMGWFYCEPATFTRFSGGFPTAS